MNQEDIAVRWGLPPGFAPLRFAVPDEVKSAVRDFLQGNEPVILAIANEGQTVSVVCTPQRLLTIKTGQGSGVTGCTIKEFPWEGITNLVMQHAGVNLKYAIHYRSKDGRTVETGMRAKLAQAAVDNVMAFENEAGTQVFEAINTIWLHKTSIQ